MQKKSQRGFTLIEILIVVAIIAILASVVLVGLGPTQAQGRDARRISDLREVQTGLELYYNKNGVYPTASTWADMTAALTQGNIGVSQIPVDPSGNQKYSYENTAGASDYVIGAQLETNSSAFAGYNPPANIPNDFSLNCTAVSKQYCLSL